MEETNHENQTHHIHPLWSHPARLIRLPCISKGLWRLVQQADAHTYCYLHLNGDRYTCENRDHDCPIHKYKQPHFNSHADADHYEHSCAFSHADRNTNPRHRSADFGGIANPARIADYPGFAEFSRITNLTKLAWVTIKNMNHGVLSLPGNKSRSRPD